MVLFKKMPRNMAAMATAALLLAIPVTSAYAIGGLGDIVYDPSNYAEAIKQVQSWEQQYQQMTQSLEKAQSTLQQVQSHLSAVTGNRGFGDLLNNPLLKTIVPSDLSTTLSSLNSSGTLTGAAASIRSSSQVYNCGDITDAGAKVACLALLGQNAQAQSVQQNTMALLNQRTTQIEALRSQIDATSDPKSIAELQARLEAEQAQVANDQNKIALTNAMLMSNQAAAAQAQQERVAALMATNKTSVLDNFSFTSLGFQPAAQTADVAQ
jgi:type IV secretion system protein VirB5